MFWYILQPKVWPHYRHNNQSVGELWLGLFKYYCEEFNIEEQVVTIRQSETLTKFEKLWNRKCIAIEGKRRALCKYWQFVLLLLTHLSRRLTRWAYRMGLEQASVRPSVHPSVRPSTLSNMNISETSRLIRTKFYLKHHWGGGKAALGFDADQIRTVVSMATDSSHRVIMVKRASSRFLDCFWSDPVYTCRYLWHT